jgi:hypothetical protein
MSTFTATLPVLGHSLSTGVTKFFAALFTAPKATAATKAKAAAATPPPGAGVWKLYRMIGGMDSVHPALFIDRIVQD